MTFTTEPHAQGYGVETLTPGGAWVTVTSMHDASCARAVATGNTASPTDAAANPTSRFLIAATFRLAFGTPGVSRG